MLMFKSTSEFVFLLALCFCSARVWRREDENIGALLPIRNDRACESFGLHGILTVEAVLYAIDEINSGKHLDLTGGLGYDLRDSCPDAYKSTRDLVLQARTGEQNSSFAAVVSSLPYENVESLLLLLTKRLPFVGCGSFARQTVNKHLDGASTEGKIFHAAPSDKTLVKAMSDVMDYFSLSDAVVIYDEQTISRSVLDFLEEETTKRNACIVKTFGIQANKDVDRQIGHVVGELRANLSVSGVMLLTPPEVSSAVMKEVAMHGPATSHITWVMGKRSWDRKMSGRVALGALILDPSAQTLAGFRGHLGNLRTDPIRNKWLRKLVGDDHTQFSSTPSLVACNDPTDPQCRINGTALEHVVAELVTVAEDATCILDAVFAVAHALAAREQCSPPCPPGAPLYQQLRGVDFNSPTGRHVSFASDGYLKEVQYRLSITEHFLPSERVPAQGKTGNLLVIGTWTISGPDDASRLAILPGYRAMHPGPRHVDVPYCAGRCHNDQCKRYQKDPGRGGCCWQCHDCHVVAARMAGKSNQTPICPGEACPQHVSADYVRWSDTGTLVLLFLVAFGLCFGLYVACVLVHNRDTRVMRRAKNATVALLPFILLLFLLPLPLLSKPSEISCEAYRAAFLFTLGIPLAVLIAKAQVVHDAFYDCDGNVKRNWTCCSPRTTVIFLVLVIHVIFLVVVRFAEPAEVLTLPATNSTPSFLECSVHSSVSFPIMVLFLLIGAGLVSIMSLRDVSVPGNDYEVKWVSLCMFFWYILAFVYVALMFSLHGKYKILALGFLDFLHASNLFACLYVPKWFVVVFRPERNCSAASPFDVYLKAQEKVSLRLSSQGDQSPVLLKRGTVVNNNASNDTSADVKDTYV